MAETRAPVDYASIVEILDRAERERLAIPPLTDTYPGLSVQDAYAVQAATLRRRLGDGKTRLIGRKVGLTAKAMQEQLGVNEPDFGFLLSTMLVASGGTISRAALLQPRVEPEIAFYLKSDLAWPRRDRPGRAGCDARGGACA